jgi:hypothetical protein
MSAATPRLAAYRKGDKLKLKPYDVPTAGLEIHCEKGTAKVALDLSNIWRAPRQFSGQYMGTTATAKNSEGH